ncbi:hypothetical protein EVAR_90127_1 [Eumeta japonica]|uniref:Helitron helicase-like domain-containing protein n=1 Tax=Eumeta variegata TaxID=151549 RepID=A0A4C1ZXK8_EUMVA|nr:hypothetical protein EVAR_90127_1 [Eumeta japonica]
MTSFGAKEIREDSTPGRYNAPAVNEVAVLLVDEEKGPRDIVLHGRDGQLKRVSELHRSYDPLQYPLMFVKGEDGYYLTIPQEGSPRYLHEKTQDAMTYVRNYGRPDLFVTFTCNPEWPEIKAELLPDQRSFDRHDIISRVFHLKMKKFLNLFVKDEIFGKVKCYMASVEWQKRAPCMKTVFAQKYPRRLVNETQTGEDGYPVYRRRDAANGGLSASLNIRGRNFTIDNSWIVPYSPLLCRTFNAHINVEYCHSVQAIKYICKYINKGSDQATFGVRNPNDEVENYVNGRYISTSEAAWRIFEFPIHERHPTVLQLAVHLENGQRVYFTTETAVQVAQNPRKTTLLAFFELCNEDEFAKHFFTTKSRNTTHGPIISSPEGSVVRM